MPLLSPSFQSGSIVRGECAARFQDTHESRVRPRLFSNGASAFRNSLLTRAIQADAGAAAYENDGTVTELSERGFLAAAPIKELSRPLIILLRRASDHLRETKGEEECGAASSSTKTRLASFSSSPAASLRTA